MAMVSTQSFCIIHPDSEFDDPKFSFSDSQVGIEAPHGGGGRGSDPQFAPAEQQQDAVSFDRVFAPKTSQEKVFQVIAKTPVLAALENFSSAAFIALGATGGGKTFTVTGGAKRFADRGLIPRSISALFEALCARKDREELEVAVSFYELYKDGVVDLLSEKRRRVALQPGEHGPVLVGLLKQAVATESDAYHLLFQGDSNRHFERMPMNAETSRGHVFYVLHLSHPRTGRKATLSFIDLAAVVSTRNQATASIAQSLDALRAAVSAMHAGARPAFEASPLTQLLQPWMQPPSGTDPVQVALISPIRYVAQMQRELHEWLLFSRLFREAMRGSTSRTERRDFAGLASGGLMHHSFLDRRGGAEQDQLGPLDRPGQLDWLGAGEKAPNPELLVPPLPKHPDGPFAPMGSAIVTQENMRARKDSEATLLGRPVGNESRESRSLGDSGTAIKVQESSPSLMDQHRFERLGNANSVGVTPLAGQLSSGTLQAPQQRAPALPMQTGALNIPAAVGSAAVPEGTSSGPSTSAIIQSRGSLGAPSGPPGKYPTPSADKWQHRTTTTTMTSAAMGSAVLSSAVVGSLAAPSGTPSAASTRPVSPQGGRVSPMVQSAAATPQPPHPPPHTHHMLPAKSMDFSWGASTRTSSRSSSPMATRSGDSHTLPRTNAYAQPSPFSPMSQPVGSGTSVMSGSHQQSRLPFSNVYAHSRPVSPQPHTRTAGPPQQAWSPQPWRGAAQSRSPSPQPCGAAQALAAQAAARPLSPQPQRLAGAAAAAPTGAPRPPSPMPGGGYGAALSSYAAPPRCLDGRPGAVSPLAARGAGAGAAAVLQLDRAPTPLRVPLAGGGPAPPLLCGRPEEEAAGRAAPQAAKWAAGGGLLR